MGGIDLFCSAVLSCSGPWLVSYVVIAKIAKPQVTLAWESSSLVVS